MLVLSRKRNERIVIKDSSTGAVIITVVVSKIDGATVRIGIEADKKYRVDRLEVHDKM